ncbi:NAD(P)/FAD-dependent oxidoreductase [Aeromicrobium sp. CTD01-1L150]|uniref:NAD(P)/FAD-dependent oxidoreductase n=1 Tax=Aeromicrobium sp. CTD01-1L150 TaxID=3341830 RepID=UPI0035C044DB
MDVVIIGAGLAAAKAAIALRSSGHTGGVTIVGEETRPPYERPPLSKDYLQGGSSFEDALVEPESWYDEHDVRLVLGTRVEALETGEHRVRLAGGEVLPYDKAVLATGAVPRGLDLPGADGALVLRSAQDSEDLRAAFGSAASVVIIGAGWIGLEAAAAARAAGLRTTVLEAANVPLRQALGEEMGSYFADLHRAHDVDVRVGVSVDAVTGDGPFAVRAGGDVIETDLVLVAVGVAPATELAEAAGLLVEDGVVTDERFVTSDPDVLAIGDVARVSNTALGTPLRVEHWDNAVRQGEAVARVLLGEETTYDWLPFFFTDQYDLGMEYVGHGGPDDDTLVRGDVASGEFIAFWLDGDRVTAGMNVNIWDVNDDLRALVGRRVDREQLVDPDVPLTEVAHGTPQD